MVKTMAKNMHNSNIFRNFVIVIEITIAGSGSGGGSFDTGS